MARRTDWKEIRRKYDGNRKGVHKRCDGPFHTPEDCIVPPEGWSNSRNRKWCKACHARQAELNKTKFMAAKNQKDQRRAINALKKERGAPGLSESTVKALGKFGGLDGFLGLLRLLHDNTENDNIKFRCLHLVGQMLTSNALSGGVSDDDDMSDEELEAELQEELRLLQAQEDEEIGDDELVDE